MKSPMKRSWRGRRHPCGVDHAVRGAGVGEEGVREVPEGRAEGEPAVRNGARQSTAHRERERDRGALETLAPAPPEGC
eukprot:scaffold55349_cov52-Phaeocystis_antarctica.AAC.1